MYFLHGTEKNGTSDISMLFFGKTDALAYLSETVYANDPEQERLGSIFIWSIKRTLEHYSKDADVTVVKTDRFFSHFLKKKGFIIIPEWVEMSMTVPGGLQTLSDLKSSSAKKDIQTLQKYGYSYETSDDIEKLDFFYYKMCLPYIMKRHGKLALLELANYGDVKRNFKRGFLLFVKDSEKYIAGSLIIIRKKVAYPVYMGIVDDEVYLSRGVGAALYYFPLIWADKNGVNKINFGNTRTFLNSGDFQYKRKWGMTVNRSNIFFGIYGLLIHQPSSKKAIDVLENHPFIYEENTKLNGLIITQQPLTIEKIDSIWKHFFISGLSNLSIFSPLSIPDTTRNSVQSKYNDKILLFNSLENICEFDGLSRH
jgi:hypothetical protein